MKLIQILYSGLGGHWSVVKPLIEADLGKEYEHELIFYGREELLPAYKEFCVAQQVNYHFVQKKKGIDQSAWKKVRELLDSESPKVVLFHSASLGLPLKTWKPKNETRVILVEHTSNAVKPWKEQIGTLILAAKCHRIVHLSKDYYKEYPRYVRRAIGLENIRVIPNGINVDRYSPTVGAEIFTIAMMGRFTRGKDFMGLLKACQDLVEKRFHLKLVLAGDGEGWEEVRQYIRTEGLQDWVSLPGQLNEGELIAAMRECKLYVNWTLAETMSTITLQALSCGVPALISSISGNQIFSTSGGVQYFEVTNSEDLKEKIVKLYENEAERMNMALKARKWVVENCTMQTMFESYRSLILDEKN